MVRNATGPAREPLRVVGRRALKRVPGLRPAYIATRDAASRAAYLLGRAGLRGLPIEDQVRLIYEVMLRREVDDGALRYYAEALALGNLTPEDIVDRLRCSDEYRCRTNIGANAMLASLHLSRCEFILGLPPAETIIDLGGSHTNDANGALVLMGYPYNFGQLTIVDLPPEGRHDLYKSDRYSDVMSPRGPIRYEFRSMTDLSFAADASVDLVYSGQTIEHVTQEDGDVTLAEVHRVLRPGGYFAVDTPNATTCRLGSPDFIDPDHKVEYTAGELTAKVEAAGLNVLTRRGLNLATSSWERGELDEGEVASNPGVFADVERCYLLAYLCQKTLA